MRQPAEQEVLTIEGRTVNLRWRLARHGEWLAWCYVPALSGLHQEGVGFEARAATPDEARAEVTRRVTSHLTGTP